MIWCICDTKYGIVLEVGLAVIIKPNANGKHAWIKDYAELEVFLEMVRNNELVELRGGS